MAYDVHVTQLNKLLETAAPSISLINEDESDFEHLAPVKEWSVVDQENYGYLKEFALGEEIAHHYPYKLHLTQPISLHEGDGVSREYQRIPLKSNHGGVVGHIYVPTENNTTSRVYVSFTGTHNAATTHADLEHCPGEASFQKGKANLMAQINEVLANIPGPIELCIAGHSLGGALAQQMLVEAMLYASMQDNAEEISKLNDYLSEQYGITPTPISASACTHFDKVNHFKLYTWNAAGVSRTIDEMSTPLSNRLIQNGKQITAYIGMSDGDPVQCTGEGTVLAESQAKVVNLKVFINDKKTWPFMQKIRNLGGLAAAAAGSFLGPIGAIAGGVVGTFMALTPSLQAGIHAHTKHHFKEKEEPIRYELIHNGTVEGKKRVTKRLRNKSALLQNPVIHFGRECLHRVGKLISKTSAIIMPLSPPHAAPSLKVM